MVVPSGFEPEQTEPKSVMLPLHHGTIVLREGIGPSTHSLEGCCSIH